MKKQLLTLFTALGAGFTFGQSLPNGDFENWTNTNYENPTYWGTSNFQNVNNTTTAPNNAVKVANPFHGSFAIQLNTVNVGPDTAFAYVSNGNPGGTPTGGVPYSQQPTGISLRYKSTIMLGDSALIIVQFKKSGSLIGSYIYKIGTTQSSYTLFSAPLLPALPFAPDTVIFAAASSDAFSFSGIPGNMFQMDSVMFTGGVSQPANFDGDFENWTPAVNYLLNNWEIQNSGPGAMQTIDVHSGIYALELKTFIDPNNGGMPNMGTATTGHQVQSGTIGGTPYTQQFDSLIFWYKYTPADVNDSAIVWAQTKLSGSNVGGNFALLAPSAIYKRMAFDLNSFTTPDSLIVSAASSKTWPIPLTYAGADFKIDGMYLLSMPLGIKKVDGEKAISIFPNPSNGVFSLAIRNTPFMFIEKITLSDMNGNLIDSRSFGNGTMKTSENFDISKLGSGIYVIQVSTNVGVFTKKISKTN